MIRGGWRTGVLLVVVASLGAVFAGNTTCVDDNLDWYTNAVGETPC